jgi:peptidylprolyl isomerase
MPRLKSRAVFSLSRLQQPFARGALERWPCTRRDPRYKRREHDARAALEEVAKKRLGVIEKAVAVNGRTADQEQLLHAPQHDFSPFAPRETGRDRTSFAVVCGLMILTLLLATFTPAPPPAPPDLKTPPADARRSADGLVTRQLAAGTAGEHPGDADYIHVRYSVWKASDGSVVDYTYGRGTPFVEVSKLLPGMREMFESMTPGERLRAWIPSSLGAGKIAADDSFVVDGELVDVVHPPVTPPDVAAPPADAIKTESGLAYKVLRAGTGTAHPAKRNRVLVHYSGWTTDGHMFESSILRDQPAELPLAAVIAGWTEGLQLMTEGERARFWIPEKLAYKGKAGFPAGMLVFDVELIGIK